MPSSATFHRAIRSSNRPADSGGRWFAWPLALLLGACGAQQTAPPPSAVPAPPAAPARPAQPQGKRIVIGFHAPVPYQDPAYLQQLSTRVGAHIIYLASVSGLIHVYRVQVSTPQELGRVLQALAREPAIRYAEPDHKASISR